MNRHVTDLDRARFMFGDCHILAQAIHRITGWPIHTFLEDGLPSTHAFIVTPRKTALDIRGEQRLSAFRQYWSRHTLDGTTNHKMCLNPDEEFPRWGINFGNYSKQRAADLAPYLVAQVGK